MASQLRSKGGSYFRFANADDGVPPFPEKLGFVHLETKQLERGHLVGLSRTGRLMWDGDPKGVDDRDPAKPKEACGDRSGNDHKLAAYISKIRASADEVQWQPKELCE